ncbi:MAG: bifunctional riboflavin kinase/FAD synthetase [Cytophagaceae bacterium]
MKVYRNLDEFIAPAFPVVTIGAFDGLHLGHRKILSRLKELSNKHKGESVVVTFWPHPRMVLLADASVKLLSSLEEKIDLIEATGIEHLIIIPFTKDFSETTSQKFLNDILINTLKTKMLVIGYDHKFGKNREGSFDYLKENASQFGFQVEEISRQDIEDMAISSTAIRESLAESDVKKASEFLGRYYSVRGTVTEGKKLGRTIGYPTANILVKDYEKLLPGDGIYAVRVKVENKSYNGMLSLGNNPTVPGKGRSMEVHIFDFSDNIYFKNIEVFFIDYLRKEEKFSSLEALTAQLKQDEINSQRILASISTKIQ